MERNTVVGFVLIAAVLIGFTYYSSKTSEEEQAKKEIMHAQDSIDHSRIIEAGQQSINANTAITTVDDFFAAPAIQDTASLASNENETGYQERVITLENAKVKINLSTKGGQMKSAELKNYKKFDGDSLYLFNGDANFYLELRGKQGQLLQTQYLHFQPILSNDGDNQSAIMRYAYSPNQYIDFIYTLSEDDYMLKYDIALVGMDEFLSVESSRLFELYWTQDIPRQEKSIENEQRYSQLHYKYASTSDVEKMSESSDEKISVKESTKWIAFKDQFFSAILIADDRFVSADLESKKLASDNYLKAYSAKIYTEPKLDVPNNALTAGFRFFLGPLEYSNLKNYDSGDEIQELNLDELVPLGWTLFRWINKYFVIPIFGLLGSTGLSMGIVILLLTLIVKLIISPLTYKSFMSSAKMRVLRPQIEELSAKYPKPEQASEKQQATMALYNKAGANPMSGCIPMLLQMPILIALFSFFPTAIELRQQSFLWATDLSTYDAIFEWTNKIPLIGNHISLFCILMTITNVIYTKFNMEMTNTGQQQMPGMKWMMYLMPVVFLFLLNDYPSGLTYYYFISLLITIVLTLIFRFTVDEEKLLAKLEANKAKKKKKSGFMARLEEAQRLQQQQSKTKAKKGGKK